MTIPAADEDRNRYFRTIAGEFLNRRGAPFFLSPRDAEIISGWEKRGIPLSAVLEGIAGSFDRTHPGAPDRGKILSLAFCAPRVERAFAIHKEKRVGGRRRAAPTRDKKRPASREAERFLASIPEKLISLGVIFREGLDILSREDVKEEALEALDERVDGILWEISTPEEREEGAADLPKARAAKTTGFPPEVVLRTVLTMRRRNRVPYLALFHY